MSKIVDELEDDMINAALAEEARPVIEICELLLRTLPYSTQGILMGMQTFIGMKVATSENNEMMVEQLVELLRLSSVPR